MLIHHKNSNSILETLYQHYPEVTNEVLKTHHFSKLWWSRRLSEIVFIILLQFLGFFYDYIQSPVLPISLGAGINLILVFWRGIRIWPGILIGTSLIGLIQGLSFSNAGLLALMITLQPCLIVWSAHKLIGPIIPFASIKDWIGYIACCSIVVGLFYWLNIHLLLKGNRPYENLLAYLLITPASLIWASYPFLREILSRKKIIGTLLISLSLSALFYALLNFYNPNAFLFGIFVIFLGFCVGYNLGIISTAITVLSLSFLLLLFALLFHHTSHFHEQKQMFQLIYFCFAVSSYLTAIIKTKKMAFKI